MSKSFKKTSLAVTMCLVLAAFMGCASWTHASWAAERVSQFVFGTYTPTGGYMLFGTGVAKAVNTVVKSVNLTAVPSPRGSAENVETVNSGEREFGIASSNVVMDGVFAREPFKEKTENVMGWFSAHYGLTWSVATKSSGIKTFKDMEGKKVAIGAPGSNDEYLGEFIFLPAAGVDVSKVNIQRVSSSEAINQMKDGQIDAMIFTGAPRFATVTELASARECVFVPMEMDAIKSVIEKYPEFIIKDAQPDEIPALNMTEAIPTVGMNHIALVNKNVDADIVYEMTKALFENIVMLHEIKEEFQVVTLEGVLKGMPIEVHPGAMRYYTEKGITK